MAALVFAIAIQAQTKSESVEQELIKLENGWNGAVVKRDGRWQCVAEYASRIAQK